MTLIIPEREWSAKMHMPTHFDYVVAFLTYKDITVFANKALH